jgi:hypothetical protein
MHPGSLLPDHYEGTFMLDGGEPFLDHNVPYDSPLGHEIDAIGIWDILTGDSCGLHAYPYWQGVIDLGLYLGQDFIFRGVAVHHRGSAGWEWADESEIEADITWRGPVTAQMIANTADWLEREFVAWAAEGEHREQNRLRNQKIVRRPRLLSLSPDRILSLTNNAAQTRQA